MPRKGNKYGAVKVVADGRKWDSKAEYARYCQLKLLEDAGEITYLTVQPKYPLIINGKKLGKRGRNYTADFYYIEIKTGQAVVEEVKGSKSTETPLYRLKRDLFNALYPHHEHRVLYRSEIMRGER